MFEHGFHYDELHLFEPITESVNDTCRKSPKKSKFATIALDDISENFPIVISGSRPEESPYAKTAPDANLAAAFTKI